MISVFVLTKNEQNDLPGCIESLSWCDDIVVIDSGSDDDTVQIAESLGATVYHNDFISFAKQRNWALDNCSAKHEWILFLDADERTPPSFVTQVNRAIETSPQSVAGFYCCWKLILDGRWLKRSDGFPKWQFRLLRSGFARFSDCGHGQKEGEVSAFGEMSGSFSLNEFDDLIENTYINLVSTLSVELKK